MNQDRFRQIDALFDEILDVSTIERERILDERCRTDGELRREILKLFSAVAKSADFIEKQDFIPVKNFLDEEEVDKFSGKKIGAYRLKKLLGRGGMGAVYRASRIDDFEKEVAVKIIPPFGNRKNSAEDFRRERQILARLEHPNIAQILDGGTADDGTPFLVMEYVDGLPLSEFCRQNELSTREKLALFQEVCRAVTFAHQNFIVHRDLKPNNILVKKDGKPKLLDFGIAKLLNAETLDFSENKTIDVSALTPEYASPEQFNGENITAASDVYSLGVVLYEILTGRRPFDFRGKSLAEILEIIQTKDAIAPSLISNSNFQISNSELDLVVLKALRKDVSERYQTVEEFRADIENYLNDQPISARSATNFYRFKKYIQRHKIESAVALLVSFLIVGWLITFAWQFRSERFQAHENRRSAYSAEMILAANEYENANLNRLREIVEKYEPKKGEEDLRGFEWYFLKNLLDPPTKIADFQHADEVWNAEFSPDGKFIATACNDNRVRIWNVENGQMIETAEQRGAWKVSFFPDGTRLAVASSSNFAPLVKIYDAATAKEIFAFKGHTKRIRAIDVAPDGKTIATGGQDGNIIVWNAETGAELHKFSFSTAQKNVEFYDLQFSKNGDRLAILGFETLAVFDTKTWRNKQADVNKFLDKNVFLNGWKVVFSPLEKTLAIGTFGGDVVFVDAGTFEILRVLKIHQSNVKSLAFSADGKILVTGSGDRTVKFVDVQTSEVINELRGHFSGVHEVVFSPDGTKLATASADFRLSIWNTEKVSKANALLTNAGIFAFSKNAEKIFGWNNTTLEISALNSSERRKEWSAKTNINAFSADYSDAKNLLVFGERDGFLSIFDAVDGREIRRVKTHERNIYAVAFAPDGKRILASYEDGLIECFDTDSGAEIFAVQASSEIIKTLTFSPDGKIFASGGNDKSVKIFDTENGKEIAVLSGNKKPLYKIVFSNDGNFLAAVGADDVARIWRAADKKLIHELSGMSAGIFAAAFSSDGKRLATASDVGVIRLWNTETGEQVLAFTASRKQVNYLRFSADGKTLTSIDADGKASFWLGG